MGSEIVIPGAGTGNGDSILELLPDMTAGESEILEEVGGAKKSEAEPKEWVSGNPDALY